MTNDREKQHCSTCATYSTVVLTVRADMGPNGSQAVIFQ